MEREREREKEKLLARKKHKDRYKETHRQTEIVIERGRPVQ